jgi:hypothetical protein
MAIIRDERDARLRFGIGVGNTDIVPGAASPSAGTFGNFGRDGAGVLLFPDIPTNARVSAWVDRPTEIPGAIQGTEGEQSDGGLLQPYAFEHAPNPPQVNFGAVPYMGSNRIFLPDGKGAFPAFQAVPAFAAFGVPVVGSLRQKGKAEHAIQMPGPNTSPSAREILRMRWTGTARAAQPWFTGDGVTKSFTFAFAFRNLAPGSFLATVTIAGNVVTIRDDGGGRLVGYSTSGGAVVDSGDGYLDYVSGKGTIKFTTAPPAGAVTAAFESDCLYKPLDVHLEWDALMAQ